LLRVLLITSSKDLAFKTNPNFELAKLSKNCGWFWKSIKDYEGLYEVSNLGRVKSLSRLVNYKNSTRKINERILKPWDNSHGYFQVKLLKHGKSSMFRVHRLVAEVFLEKLDYQNQVNHKNYLRNDNRLENLEWVSNLENNSHKSLNINTQNKYPCVSYHKQRKKWRARIRHNNKQVHIGLFDTELDAYQARVNFELNNNIKNKYV